MPIGKIATTSHNEWIIKEAVLFFATLIESEEEAFVENPSFSASLTNLLVRITGVNSVRLGLDTESRVVELAFNITTKIRLDPEILPAWFKASSQQDSDTNKDNKFAGRTQRADFPLFYILMDYIHHEGKVGDFARTGLLYIIEAASSSAALEQWIVESDLSTLMATGLGALYSQLSRKLVIDHLPHDLPPILALSDYEHPTSSFEVVSSCSTEFQSHLETFLSHLLFWQDVLNHCRSVEVKSTLLEHFQVIFLQQLLYPSLLESSDIDGGSSVAVLTYLRRILESLDHPDMINLILHYLLALPDSLPNKPAEEEEHSSVSDARRRKTRDLATMMAERTDLSATPLLFNLVDLILACLRSRNQQTIYVTLQLVSAILKRHHRYAVITLLRTELLPAKTATRTVGAHEQEVDYLMDLASIVGGYSNFDEAYDSILKDTMVRVEGHPCSLRLIGPKVSTNNHKLPALPDSLPGAPKEVREHTLRADDPLLNSILDLMESFFMNPIETNLSVTETIADMAICGFMEMEGWLVRSPEGYTYAEDEDDEADKMDTEDESALTEVEVGETGEEQRKLAALAKCRQKPLWSDESAPRILSLLGVLGEQVLKYRDSIPRFDELLQQRREAFLTADSLLDVPPPPPKKDSAPLSHSNYGTPDRHALDHDMMRTGSRSPMRPSALEGFAQRLLSELGTPTRSLSPRGNRSSGTSTPGDGSVRDYAFSKALPPTPGQPAGRGNSRSLSPSSIHDEEDIDDLSASRVAEFSAIDQTILAKRVGVPDRRMKPIPLDLTSRGNAAVEEEEPMSEDEDEHGSEDDGGGGMAADESEYAEPDEPEETATVSVSHILTNVIVFQSFVMELAALVQVRAGLFDEVRYV